MQSYTVAKKRRVYNLLLVCIFISSLLAIIASCSDSIASSVINPNNNIPTAPNAATANSDGTSSGTGANTGGTGTTSNTGGTTGTSGSSATGGTTDTNGNDVPPVITDGWKVTVDLNGGSGLTQTTYTVAKGGTLTALSNNPVPPTSNMSFGSYTFLDGTPFVLGTTVVTADRTIKIKWVVTPSLNCSAYPNAVSNLATYTANNDQLGVACAIKAGAVVSDANGNTALSNAAKSGSLENLKVLIASGADPNSLDSTGNTPITGATAANSLDSVKFLIDHGANVNTKSSTGVTPLNKAIASGSLDIVKLLIDSGANVNTADTSGDLPLTNAVASGSIDTVNYLIAHGADINGKAVTTALNKAVSSGSLDMVTLLVNNGANVNITDTNGNTPAINAAKSDSNLAILKYLVETGHADLSTPGAGGVTPIIMASTSNSLETVKYILTQGQSVNQKDNNGHTALYWAISKKSYDSFHYLLNYPGVDILGLLEYAKSLAAQNPSDTTLATMVTELGAKLPVFTVTEMPANGARPYYVAFGIKASQSNVVSTDNYYLALKDASAAKPSASEIKNGFHYQRNITSGGLWIYGWAPLGTTYTAPTTAASARNMMLRPSTTYILWGLVNNGSDADVQELKRFTTSGTPTASDGVELAPMDGSITGGASNSPRAPTIPVFIIPAGEPFVLVYNVLCYNSFSFSNTAFRYDTPYPANYNIASIVAGVTALTTYSNTQDVAFSMTTSRASAGWNFYYQNK